MRVFIASWALVAALLSVSALAANPVSPTLPLDSFVYPAIEKLEGLGLVASSLQGSRPWTRREAARLVQAIAAEPQGQSAPVVREILRALRRELAEELKEIASGDIAPASYVKPLRSARLQAAHQDAALSFLPRSNARQSALDYNRQGLEYGDGANGQVAFAADARFGRHFLLSARPLLEWQEEGGEAISLLEGKAALTLGPFEVSAGRQSLWWGQGRHGSLVLTNNAKPLDMLRITNPSPALLPWIFKYLGPFRFDVFWSQLESERVVPDPYFAGLRFNFRPLPWVELGASRGVIFGGEGRPDLDFIEYLTILGGENLSGEADTSNSVAAIDARVVLPFLWNAEIYGEMGGEDEADLGFLPFISQKAYLGGIYLPRIEPSGRASLRLEYADLTVKRGESTTWYRHSIYRSGYTYEQKVLGHHVGGGATDLFGELTLFLPGGWNLQLELDYEKRGYDQPVFEKHLQPAFELAWSSGGKLRISGRYALDFVDNLNFIPGNDETFHLAFVNLDFSL